MRMSRRTGPRGWALATVGVCLAAGLLIGTARVAAGGHDTRNRSVDLAAVVLAAQQRGVGLARSASSLQSELDRLAGAGSATEDVSGRAAAPDLSALRQQIAGLRSVAAQTAVAGPALRVTLDDAPRGIGGSYPADVPPDDLVVHQQDVQSVVNALWAGGAEAMTIMDQRVIGTSAVRCIGSTLLLQGRTYSPPFVVTAIGDRAAMAEALAVEPGVKLFQQYVDRYHLVLRQDRLADVRMPGDANVVRLTAAEQPR